MVMHRLRVLLVLVAIVGAADPFARAATAQKPYRILVMNDDGVRAPGLIAVAQALMAIGEVTIVAPADNQSGKGHSLSITDPVFVEHVSLTGGLQAFSATATPASCVKLALLAVMKERPNLVVSGINRGTKRAQILHRRVRLVLRGGVIGYYVTQEPTDDDGVSGLRGVVIGAPIGAALGALLGYQLAK